MIPFLQGLIAQLALPFLNWAYSKLGAIITHALLWKRTSEMIKERHSKIKKQTESAKTKQERERAVSSDSNSW